jgi:adenosylcobinamide-GDP ribazoletransferase
MPNGLRTAVGFLTRIPIDVPEPDMGRAAPWFPVVGVGIGAAQGVVLYGLGQIVPPMVAAVVAVAAAALITGAFHLDGLADVADAFGGGWDVEQRMTILKDSRLGTYGTTAAALALLTETVTLASLSPSVAFGAAVVAQCLSRSMAVATMAVAPLAGDGLGASYARSVSPLGAAAGVVVGLAITAAVLVMIDGTAMGLVAAATAVGLAAVAAAAMVALARSKIGGVTGDVLGAVQVLALLAILVAITVWFADGPA